MEERLICNSEMKRPGNGFPGSVVNGSFFQRKIDFHPAGKPLSLYNNKDDSEFSSEALNPGWDSHKGFVLGSGSVKNLDLGGEFLEHGLDPELSFRITFRRIGAGLANLGNTCFLNSVLQCLTYTEPFAAYLQSGKHKSSCHTSGFCAMCAIQNHVSNALQSTGKIVSPSHLVKNLRCISRNFCNSRQEDAHEYMVNLLESMHKCCLPYGVSSESPSAYEKSLVHKIFGGRLRSQVKCMQCSYCSNTFDPFLDLSLEIVKADSLRKALTYFTAAEKLDGGERQYRCQRCKEKVRALKQLTVHKAPYVLTIHLKRFGAHNPGQKIDKMVDFGPHLDLKPFASDPQEGDLKYTLYGVLVHAGWSTHSGHYYCFVRTSSGAWYALDDNRVFQVSEKNVLDQKAYMLFYVRDRKNLAPKKPVNSVCNNMVKNTRQNKEVLLPASGLRQKLQNCHAERLLSSSHATSALGASSRDQLLKEASGSLESDLTVAGAGQQALLPKKKFQNGHTERVLTNWHATKADSSVVGASSKYQSLKEASGAQVSGITLAGAAQQPVQTFQNGHTQRLVTNDHATKADTSAVGASSKEQSLKEASGKQESALTAVGRAQQPMLPNEHSGLQGSNSQLLPGRQPHSESSADIRIGTRSITAAGERAKSNFRTENHSYDCNNEGTSNTSEFQVALLQDRNGFCKTPSEKSSTDATEENGVVTESVQRISPFKIVSDQKSEKFVTMKLSNGSRFINGCIHEKAPDRVTGIHYQNGGSMKGRSLTATTSEEIVSIGISSTSGHVSAVVQKEVCDTTNPVSISDAHHQVETRPKKLKKFPVLKSLLHIGCRRLFLTLSVRKKKKHKRRKQRTSNVSKSNLTNLKEALILIDQGQSTSEKAEVIDLYSTHSQQKTCQFVSKKRNSSGATNASNNCTGIFVNIERSGVEERTSHSDAVLATIETQEKYSSLGAKLSSAREPDVLEKNTVAKNGMMSMLLRGLEETTVAWWDDMESPSTETRVEKVRSIGYVADKWNEEYDRGKRKKVRKSSNFFDGANPFQEIAAKKAKTKKMKRVDRTSSGYQPFRI